MSLSVIWLVVTVLQILQYEWFNRRKAKLGTISPQKEAYKAETSTDSTNERLDARYAL